MKNLIAIKSVPLSNQKKTLYFSPVPSSRGEIGRLLAVCHANRKPPCEYFWYDKGVDLSSIELYFDIKSIVLHAVSKYFFVQSQTSLMLYKVPLFFWKPLKYEQLKQDSSR